MNGAELIADYLVQARVPYVVTLCGHGNLGMLDALAARQDEITTISVHHEAAAGFISDAYYRVRRSPLATLTSCGPGSAQLLVALGAALMDSSALLAITGDVPATQFGRLPFQELGRHYQADFPGAARPYVKRSFQATRTDQLPVMLPQAFAAMLSGRPGPVNLDVPLNVFAEPAPPGVSLVAAGAPPRSAAAPADVAAALDLLLGAERPVIVVGQGAADGTVPPDNPGPADSPGPPDSPGSPGDLAADVAAFAADAGIPVLSSPAGKDLTAGELYLGPTGRNGTLQANRAARHADVILALGTRFDDRSTSSWLPGYTYAIPPARLIHVHGDPAEIGRNYPVTVGISAQVATVTGQLRRELLARRLAGDSLARPGAPGGPAGGRPCGSGPRSGSGTSRRPAPRTPCRCIRPGCSPNCARSCPPTASWCPMWARITTGSSRSGGPAGRARYCRAGDSRRWGSASPGCSARDSRHRPARSGRWSATAGS